jgi:hypothetical protein
MMGGGFPNMQQAVLAWAKETTIFIVAKSQKDFKTVESYYQKTAKIMRVPTGQPLQMKREGQRGWNSETVFAENSLVLKIDDIIVFDCETGQKFRVINKTDYSQFGFVEYQLTADYRS